MPYIQIEYPSVGKTYRRQVYGVYEYGVYPNSSVLAGRTRRVFLDDFETLNAAQTAYPTAHEAIGTGYIPLDLSDLPDDDEATYTSDEPPEPPQEAW